MNENEKINLSADEIEVIHQQLNGEFGAFTATPRQQQLIMGVTDKALALADKLNAYDDVGEDLIEWYYNKYLEQEEEEENAQ